MAKFPKSVLGDLLTALERAVDGEECLRDGSRGDEAQDSDCAEYDDEGAGPDGWCWVCAARAAITAARDAGETVLEHGGRLNHRPSPEVSATTQEATMYTMEERKAWHGRMSKLARHVRAMEPDERARVNVGASSVSAARRPTPKVTR